MSQSIGNALLFNIIITIVIILVAFFVGSLSYTKAFKVKNRIIEEIEKNQTFNSAVEKEVNEWLASGENGKGIGYRKNTRSLNNSANCSSNKGGTLVNKTSDYQYCVYEINTCTANKSICGKYYRVTTYMYFDVPIIDELIKIPVNGETMIFNEINS